MLAVTRNPTRTLLTVQHDHIPDAPAPQLERAGKAGRAAADHNDAHPRNSSRTRAPQ
jgi:hypothetical protein